MSRHQPLGLSLPHHISCPHSLLTASWVSARPTLHPVSAKVGQQGQEAAENAHLYKRAVGDQRKEEEGMGNTGRGSSFWSGVKKVGRRHIPSPRRNRRSRTSPCFRCLHRDNGTFSPRTAQPGLYDATTLSCTTTKLVCPPPHPTPSPHPTPTYGHLKVGLTQPR